MITHLQVHSAFSLYEATPSVAELVERARVDGLRALALTDTALMTGAVAFDRACRAAGIQAILGLTVPVTADPGLEQTATPGDWLVLLATSPAGYRSLCRLSSRLQGPAGTPRPALSWEALAAHREGLIGLSGGRRGRLEGLVRVGDVDEATRYLARLAATFPGAAYVSLELHRPSDAAVAATLTRLGRQAGLPAVAVQPIHYLRPADRTLLSLLAAIERNCLLKDVDPASLPHGGDPAVSLGWLSPAEMQRRFAKFPEALAQIDRIIDRCRPALPDGQPIWPRLELPAGQGAQEALAIQAESGLQARYRSAGDLPRVRLERELASIGRHGYAPLFLILADVVRFVRQAAIPISTRGSVANSLVAYCLGITSVDPVAHDLLFERFLNPARSSLPDIDLDLCSRRRDEVLAYVRDTYGADRVALVATINSLRPRSAVRAVAKAYGLDGGVIGRLAARLHDDWHPDPRRRRQVTLADLAAAETDRERRMVLEEARRLVGFPSHLGLHPGGMVIAPGPMTDYCPLHWSPKGFLATQFDHTDVEALGLIKIDLLGIRALSAADRAASLIRRQHDPGFRLEAIPRDDEATGRLLAAGDTIGVFQAESVGAIRTLRQLRARSVRDLAVANAFFKPGPATGGMADEFVRRYRGESRVRFLHPALAPILAPTQGVLLFQEQILRVVVEIAGLSWADADQVRRGMSKFEAERIQTVEARFLAGCQATAGLSPAQAATLWRQVLAFAGYGFNQGHATAYADVTYQLAFLKAHYPAEFLCARLSEAGGYHHPAVYVAEARRLGLTVRPPHVNHSYRRFSLSDNGAGQTVLWQGLGAVKGLRRAAIRRIVQGRDDGRYASLPDLMRRAALQATEIAHLIQAGALDGLGAHRAALLVQAGELHQAGAGHQLPLFTPEATTTAPETLTQRLAWERTLLGMPMSGHPVEIAADLVPDRVPVGELAATAGRRCQVLGVRLPGHTGGPGFYLDDGAGYVLVRPPAGSAARHGPWWPLLVSGRWRPDRWGGGRFEADQIRPLRPATGPDGAAA